MTRKIKLTTGILVLLILQLVSSCGVNSNLMFKEPKGEVYTDSIPMKPMEDYRISKDDKISFILSTNEGAVIVDQMTGVSQANNRNSRDLEYVVRKDGMVNLPVLGDVYVDGLTIKDCEDTLTAKFTMYQDPFVQVQITNQRVIVFPGNGSDAKVITLINPNTTLMEAIALAGGITDRGKAKVVKLMRYENDIRKVYHMDLSTIDGLKYADLIVQANDYIYVEPTPDIMREINQDFVPVMALFSSIVVILTTLSIIK